VSLAGHDLPLFLAAALLVDLGLQLAFSPR
jgi:hypothetical protein